MFNKKKIFKMYTSQVVQKMYSALYLSMLFRAKKAKKSAQILLNIILILNNNHDNIHSLKSLEG